MKTSLEDFIKDNAKKVDLCFYYKKFPKEVQEMTKKLYLACFRFGLYKQQIIYILNEALEPLETQNFSNDLIDLS